MYNTNEKNIKKKFIKRGNKILWVAAIFVGRSERGNKQNFILGPMSRKYLQNSPNYFRPFLIYMYGVA
jgi:hypothetical protein